MKPTPPATKRLVWNAGKIGGAKRAEIEENLGDPGLADLIIQDVDIGPLQPKMSDLILFYDHPSDAARVRAAMIWRAEHSPTL